MEVMTMQRHSHVQPPATEPYPERGAALSESADTYRATAVQHQPWSPAQLVALAAGVLFVVLGGIALARTGINLNDLTGKHVTVAGAGQTQLMAYIEIVFGAVSLVAGSIPGAGRGGMTFLGVLALIFGIIVVAQPKTFTPRLGIGNGYGIFLIVVGAVLLITAMIAPVYLGGTRRAGTVQRRQRI
jgi:uncharacterized membrane protein HdeD (DUF308 family)